MGGIRIFACGIAASFAALCSGADPASSQEEANQNEANNSLAPKTAFNAFVEPQYTVLHDGDGMPRWQVFAGVNPQLPLGR